MPRLTCEDHHDSAAKVAKTGIHGVSKGLSATKQSNQPGIIIGRYWRMMNDALDYEEQDEKACQGRTLDTEQ